MMPPDNTPASPKDQVENQGGSDSKKATRPTPPEQGLKCPRCDSPNTKFCYYNNYSLTQPRHFCKTCRRYWTNGGALRNVPIGGGCRKNKKVKTSSSSSSSSLSRLSCDSNKDSASSPSELAGLRFLQLGGLPLPFPARVHHHQPSFTTGIYNQFSSFGERSVSATTSASSSFQLDPSGGTSDSLIGLNYPFSSSTGSGLINGAIQGMNSMNVNSSSLASSIESLSSINQDLHWKLQQQRLAMMFGGGDNNQKDKDSSCSVSFSHQVINLEKPQPILFQNLEISKPDEMFQAGNSRKEGPSGDAPIECFFGNSYNSSVMTPATTTSSAGNGHENANNNNWSSGVHAWGDVQQQPYSTLP